MTSQFYYPASLEWINFNVPFIMIYLKTKNLWLMVIEKIIKLLCMGSKRVEFLLND